MSKITFSQKVSDMLTFKINTLENLDYDNFLKNENYFELVLCLAYLVLSKEKIIEKDIKNPQRIDRLTKKVPTIDIDAVFASTFSKQIPNIINARENNNMWILDTIRDSIMHCAFEIDEERECLILNNTQHDRDLQAEIPFSWIIDYAKYDILSKKVADKYTIKGFYYNKRKKDRLYLITEKEIKNNIMYNVRITGNKFNVRLIEDRIRELFEQYSQQEIDDNTIELYRERISKETIKYNEQYLVSFYIAAKKIQETIEQEFPGTNVSIDIDNRKGRLTNKLTKRMPKYITNYDVLYEELNNSLRHKSSVLLNYISNIIEILDTTPIQDEISMYGPKALADYILKGKFGNYTSLADIYTCHENGLNILRNICFNLHGLVTLVINQENLYRDYYKDKKTSDYGIRAYSTSKYLNYSEKERSLILQILDKEIALFEKEGHLNKCTSSQGAANITKAIKNILIEKENLEKELSELPEKMEFIPHINYSRRDIPRQQFIYERIDEYRMHFANATTVEDKRKIRKIIKAILEEKQEEEAKYTTGICHDMEEAITIIRNSLSHIGRISVGRNNNQHTILVLNDFDNHDKYSGAVIATYGDLINILNLPLQAEKTKTKTLTNR